MSKTGTLVYSPGVKVLIETARNGILDVSPDLEQGSVSVTEDSVSSFNFSLINHRRKYDHLFTPNDRVTVRMKRVRWVQVFAGYLNAVPYWSVYPRSVPLTASCALKRLQYTLWDAGSQAAFDLLHQSGDVGSDRELDGGIGSKAFTLLTHENLGNIPKEHVLIGAIPDGWFDRIAGLYESVAGRLNPSSDLTGGAIIGGSTTLSGLPIRRPDAGNGYGVLPYTSGKCSFYGVEAKGNFAITSPESPRSLFDNWYCLPKDTLVYTENGPRAICKVQVNEKVWGFDGERLDLFPVVRNQCTGVRQLWEIKTLNQTLKLTPDHRVLTLTQEGTRKTRRSPVFEWKEAQEICKGDVILTAQKLTNFSSDSKYPSEGIAEIVGRLVADGSRNKKYKKWVSENFHDGIKRFEVCITNEVAKEKFINKISDVLKVEVLCESKSGRKRCCLSFRTTELQEWCAEVMRLRSCDRFIPEWVWTAPDSVKLSFLNGYMIDGDGSIGQLETTQGTETVAAKSEQLVKELRVLCIALGFRVTNIGVDNSRSSFSGDDPKTSWRFSFYRDASTRYQVPTTYAYPPMELDDSLAARTVCESHLLDEEDETWDIEVESAHSFVAEGIVVHNCAMRFPYTNLSGSALTTAKNWWRGDGHGRRLIVFSRKTNKAVCVRAADWGPAAWTGRVIDVSPTALNALGVKTDDVLEIRFAPSDSTPTGVYTGLNESVVQTGQGTGDIDSGLGSVNSFASGGGDQGSSRGLPADSGYSYNPLNTQGLNIRGADMSGIKPSTLAGANFVNAASKGKFEYAITSAKRSGSGRESYHNVGKALDFGDLGGAIKRESFVALWNLLEPLAQGENRQIDEMFYDPIGAWDNGIKIAPIGGHSDHLHVSFRYDDRFDPTGAGNPVSNGGSQFLLSEWGGSPDPLSNALSGPLALMNDDPLLQTVQLLMNSSMRKFMSAPNGDFMAWFPDYFGTYNMAAKMEIEPIELMGDGFTVMWSDKNLITHQFTAGSVVNFSQAGIGAGVVDSLSMLQTKGVASIEFPEIMQALFNISPNDPIAKAFLDKDAVFQRFGARKDFQAMGQIYGSRAEFWYALFLFQHNWAAQFSSSVELTFMPELWPGMLLTVPAYGFQAYVEQVTHNFDFRPGGLGFTTQVSITAPSATDGSGLFAFPRGE